MPRPSKTVIAQVIGIVGLAIFMAMSVYWFTRNRPPAAVPAPPPPNQSTEIEPDATAPAPDPETPPEPVSTTPTVNPTPKAAPVKNLPGPDLSGVWELREQTDEGLSPAWLRITLAYADDATLQATSDSFLEEWAAIQNGASLTLDARRRETKYTFAGTVDPARTTVSGTVSWEYGGGELETHAAHLIRLSEEFLQDEARRKAIQAKRVDEVDALFNALHRFAQQNGGRFPASLSQIPSDLLPDPAMLASGPGRTVVYTGGEYAVNRERAAAITRELNSGELSTEQLVSCEQRLLEIWGTNTLVRPVILEVRYDAPPLIISYDASSVRSVDEQLPQDNLPEPPADDEALRDSEYNNLKQLGLVLKMFEAEHKGFLPGGWFTVFPEYLTDPHVLHSPWAPGEEVSYDLVFPGARTADLHELTFRLIDSGRLRLPPERAQLAGSPQFPVESVIPAVISRNPLPGKNGDAPARAVLFLDGHVEAIRPDRWETVVAPFLLP